MTVHSTQTPNVVIENPRTRRIIRSIVDGLGLAVATAVAVDIASNAFDIVEITAPIGAGLLVLRAGFGFGVDNMNTPKG